jgi:hypothetical protein
MNTGPDFRSGYVRDQQAMRRLDALPWAPRQASVGLSKLVIFGLTPVCLAVWLMEKFG